MTDGLPVSIQTLLVAWGRSRLVNDPDLVGYPHKAAFAVLARQSGGWALGAAPLDEETHSLVDAAVSQLKIRNVDRHAALVAHYVYRLSDSRAARKLKVSRSTARDLRVSAEAWVEGRLLDMVDFKTVNTYPAKT